MKLASRLPKGDANGLGVIAPALVRDPHAMHIVIAVVDCSRVTTDTDDGSIEPTARIRRVEVIGADDQKPAEQLLRRALETRMGGTVLPLDVEDELSEIFGAVVDPATGEILDGGAT